MVNNSKGLKTNTNSKFWGNMIDKEKEELRKTVILLEEEVCALRSPPYLPATILDTKNGSMRVVTDSGEIYEIPTPKESSKEVYETRVPASLGDGMPQVNFEGGQGKKQKKAQKSNAKRSEPVEEKYKCGRRVILNPMTKAIVGYSEFSSTGGEVVGVEEILEGKIRVLSKGEPRIVLNSVEGVKVGDEVMLDPRGAIAVYRFEKKKTRYALEEIPTAPWDKIGGLEAAIGKIKAEIEDPFAHKEIFEKYGRKPAKGILLYGPPGCGKTLIAKSIAYNLAKAVGKDGGANGHFIKVNGPEILDKWVGNSEANIRRIYQAARETASGNGSPVVVFIDEAEAVLKTRGSGISTDVYDSIVPQFLAEMDGLNGEANVITILASNREDIIDPAILRDGRVDRRINIPRPNQEGTSEIFLIYLKGKPISKKGDPKAIADEMAAEIFKKDNIVYSLVSKDGVMGNFLYSHLISGAMIRGIVDRACGYAIHRELEKGASGITKEDLEKATREEFLEHTGFAQALVKEDWENVFGSIGRQYEQAYKQGYLILENILKGTSETINIELEPATETLKRKSG